MSDSPESIVSARLRNTSGVSNEHVYADLAFLRKLEKKRIDKGRKPLPKYSRRVPSPWECLGRGRINGILTESGRFLEVWISPQPLHVGNGVGGQKLAAIGKQRESEEHRAMRVNARARKQIRRIVNANNLQSMHTLTLAPCSEDNDLLYDTVCYCCQKDYGLVRTLFKRFVQRLMRKLNQKSIPYLVVFELHDSARTRKAKRGTWHLHLCTQTSEAIEDAVRACWTHGGTNYQDYRYDKQGNRRDTDICNPGAYVAEYIGKGGAQFGAQELRDKKRYTTGRDTLKPIKRSLDECGATGDLERIVYNGKSYKCIYYNATTIPGGILATHNAHYVQE